ncbi:BON domain-containing protein [Pseudoxanthomonas sp. SGNA-20]|jgi:Predicted periplasmic or secreted lipoprotein|uniref:Hyperosmotically inducible protein n=1 Tax=Pseudoxanthomonas taiwanensis J19 TaxID=935569 RepID=A0A562DII7_9GAMM|nr:MULTISPECIES: BON domain-containing protein [Pseudoxanthomonas]RRN53915.1 BON domain-containing protein [Pseudoxanthomonas sp. SGNA-20]RRN78310.1 BON domain-containing protein [Pseudoxanthomonas sp. SGD-10]TWH09415.1 hyperosmotically inducible protein [Pseudoxanthomonas taiwanensis J19]
MRKNATVLAATFAALLFSGAAMAGDNDPQKKKAADADSSQPVSDTWITTKVKSSLLADSDVSGTKIEVDTVDGVVYLTGTVGSQAQADEAKRIAGEIDGVAKVDTSRLKVDAQASR